MKANVLKIIDTHIALTNGLGSLFIDGYKSALSDIKKEVEKLNGKDDEN